MSLAKPSPPIRATVDDLARTPGKAELINGRIVHMLPTGYRPNRVAANIFQSLDYHAKSTGRGIVVTNNIGFVVPELPSGRQSFSPDAAYHLGPIPDNDMDFIEGAPTFAVEVRSKNDYGPAAEAALAAKRADYFAAGTLVVWDVDPLAETIHCYRAATPDQPVSFHKGQTADAEPAVPSWRVAVDGIFS